MFNDESQKSSLQPNMGMPDLSTGGEKVKLLIYIENLPKKCAVRLLRGYKKRLAVHE